jgi:aspartyl/glutamyl-tRNA(Asn/Gln) amidotransferase C subunit
MSQMSNPLLKSQLVRSVRLAHLELAPAEKKALLKDLGEILNFVTLIKKSQTQGEKMFGKTIAVSDKEFPQLKKTNAAREDVIAPFDNVKAIIGEFPEKKENLIKVKRV